MNGLRWAATPHAPAPTGFLDPLDALVSVSNLPGVFHPGPSVGFDPSGLFLLENRAGLSTGTGLPDVETAVTNDWRFLVFKAFNPSRSAPSGTGLFGRIGPVPSWAFRLSKVFPCGLLVLIEPAPSRTSPSSSVTGRRRPFLEATHSKAASVEPMRDLHEVFTPFRHLTGLIGRAGLAMSSLGNPEGLATRPGVSVRPVSSCLVSLSKNPAGITYR